MHGVQGFDCSDCAPFHYQPVNVPSRHRLLDIVGKAKIGGYANDFTKFAADMEIMIAHVLTFKEITSAEYIEGRIRGLGGLASAKNPLRTLVMRSC